MDYEILSYCNPFQAEFLPYFQLVMENICPLSKTSVVFWQQLRPLTCPSHNLSPSLTFRPHRSNSCLAHPIRMVYFNFAVTF